MLALQARFLSGRYHATAWDRHVNEGAAEWPPSPYRLLRALVSSWRRTARDLPEDAVAGLVSVLSREAVQYGLPLSAAAHKRHYMPTDQGPRLTFDAFTSVEGPVFFVWPGVELTDEQEGVLDLLLAGVPYLGRAESRCELSRCGEVAVNATESDATEALVRVLCPEPGIALPDLMVSSEELRALGAGRPPLTAWRFFRLGVGERVKPVVRRGPRLVTFLLEPSVPRGHALNLADRVRRRLLASGDASSTLLGKLEDEARVDGHQHLHVLPMGESNLNRVDLWAPEGFGEADLEVLLGLTLLAGERGKAEVRLLLWDVCDDRSVFGASEVWRSFTPYLLARHPKSHGRDSLVEQVRRDCALRGLPVPEVEMLDGDGRRYVVRRGPRKGPPGPPAWMRLRFPEVVEGPLCLGGSAHFGMGRFVPE